MGSVTGQGGRLRREGPIAGKAGAWGSADNAGEPVIIPKSPLALLAQPRTAAAISRSRRRVWRATQTL